MPQKTTTRPKYDLDEVMMVVCPQCGAGKGRRCRTVNGLQCQEPHTLRKGVVYPRFLREETGRLKRGLPLVSDDSEP